MKVAINDNGILKVFNNLPRIWYNKTGIHKLPKLDLMVLGFFPIYSPPLGEYEKYGDLTIDDHWGNKYIMPIISMTQEEKDEYDDEKLLTDVSAIAEDQAEIDGKNAYIFIRNKIKRAYVNEVLTQSEFKMLRKNLLPIIIQLNYGAFDLVLDDLDEVIPYIPEGILRTIATEIRTKVNNYIINNLEE